MGERRVVNGWIYEMGDDGVARRVGPSGNRAVPVGPPNPRLPAQVQGDILGNRRTQTQTIGDALQNAINQATLQAQIRQRNAQAVQAEADAQAARMRALGITPERLGQLKDRDTAINNLERLTADMERQYQQNFRGKPAGRLFGLTELLPGWMNEDNQRFTNAGNRAGAFISSILGIQGKEADAAAEYERKIVPYLPQASDRDGTIEDKLRMLNDFINAQRSSTNAALGRPAQPARRSSLDRPPDRRQQQQARSRVVDFSQYGRR